MHDLMKEKWIEWEKNGYNERKMYEMKEEWMEWKKNWLYKRRMKWMTEEWF